MKDGKHPAQSGPNMVQQLGHALQPGLPGEGASPLGHLDTYLLEGTGISERSSRSCDNSESSVSDSSAAQ